MQGLVKTELVCPEIWGDQERIAHLPLLRVDEILFLDFTVPEVGPVRGPFRVADSLHILESRGYIQRLRIAVVTPTT